MSERVVDWIPMAVVAVWSAGVAFQASSAFYGWWTKPRNGLNTDAYLNRIKQRIASVRKVIGGGKVNGWKTTGFESSSSSRPRYALLLPLWPKSDTDAPVDTSVLVVIECARSPNGNCERVYIIRRYSLIAPGIYDDIVQIFFDFTPGGWWPAMQSYVNENTVAIGWWKRDDTNKIRIVLIDINSRSYQLFETTWPHRDDVIWIRAMFKNTSNGRLVAMLCVEPADNPNTSTFHLIEFDISPSEIMHSAIASRQLDWPHGFWDFRTTIDGFNFPGAFYVIYSFDIPGESRVVSLDHNGIHDLGAANDWIAKFKTTAIGRRIAEAKDSLTKVAPEGSFDTFEVHRSHLFASVNFEFYIHRPLAQPPPFSYRSAEAICLAKPNFDVADLKKEIGIEMFDGILDGKKPRVIRM